MATTRIMPLHIGKGRTESQAVSDIIDYVANPQKTDNGKLITGYGCDSRTADAEFLLAKRQYIAATGRVRGADDVIAYHVRQSFKPGEITPEEANRLGVEFAMRFTKGNHAFVVCTHIDKSHIHNHIIWSAVNMDCDRKFRNFWGSTRAVRRLSDTICIENGLSIVENPKPHGKSYNKWLGDQAKPSHREQLRVMIDRALEQKPADFDALLKLLSEMGCEVSRRGKAIRLKAPGWKNVARMDDKLGAGYSEAEIRAVLAGEKRHTPRKNSAVQPEPPKVNLLVDIQAKLQAGKGAGYARWAKVFNLKQKLFLQQLHEMDSYYVNEHIVNLLLEIRGNLRTEKQEMLSTIDRFLTLPPDERLLFAVGRRLNIFFRLDDLKNPKLHQKAEESLQQILSKNLHVDFAALCNYVRQSQI